LVSAFYHETRYKLIHKLILSLSLTLILTVPFILTLIDPDCTTHPPFFNYPLKFRKVGTNICKSPTKWGSVFKAKWGPISVKSQKVRISLQSKVRTSIRKSPTKWGSIFKTKDGWNLQKWLYHNHFSNHIM